MNHCELDVINYMLNLSINDFNYLLPSSRIASFPLPNRDDSKLLIYENFAIKQDVFRCIANHLPATSLLVTNDSKVVEARMIFYKPSGGKIEIFCLEPDARYPDVTTAFAATGSVYWKCMVGNASSWPNHLALEKKLENNVAVVAQIASREQDGFIIRLSWTPGNKSFAEILHLAGQIPLPPYIKRQPEPSDAERYQTIYARHEGSVAAPTAGLHFTPRVLEQLQQKKISRDAVTLHVGAGTFKPVKSTTIAEHDMHSEIIEVKTSFINNLLRHQGKPVIAVGTTSLRTLESLYWIGVNIFQNKNLSAEELQVKQWQPYSNAPPVSAVEALTALLAWLDQRNQEVLVARTSLLIAPPYNFKIVSVLITNFHQPKSTLLLLVAAFIGTAWKSVYSYALENDFRFLSYGDSCLLFRQ